MCDAADNGRTPHDLAQLGDVERERVTRTAAEVVARGTRGGSGNPV